MYERYIPPSKASNPATEPPAVNSSSKTTTASEAKPNSDGFGYSRYVPTVRADRRITPTVAPQTASVQYFDDEPSSPAPKRKRAAVEETRDSREVDSKKLKKSKETSSQVEASKEQSIDQSQEIQDEEAAGRTRRRRRRRKSEKEDTRDSPEAEDGPADGSTRTETNAHIEDTPDLEQNDTVLNGDKKSSKKSKSKVEKEKKKRKKSEKPSPEPELVEDADVSMADVDEAEPAAAIEDIQAPETAITVETEKPRKKKKEKGRTRNDASGNPDGEEDAVDKRHKSVLERKSKSLKLASERAQDIEDIDSVDEGELHGLEPLPQPEPAVVDTSKPTYETLPSWLAAPIRVSHDKRIPFAELGILPKAARVLEEKGYKDAFAVQTAAIPLLLPSSKQSAGDLLISAATGSGKTLAYALPIVRDLSQGRVTRLKTLVVLPTRELVKQAQDVFELCARAFEGGDRKKVRVGIAIGSQALRNEQEALMDAESRYDPEAYEALQRELEEHEILDPMAQDTHPRLGRWEGEVVDFQSKVDVLICTPGRLVEHLEQTPGFNLDFVRWLVVDEADKLLAQSFQGWLELIMEKFQTNRFSARDFPDMNLSGVRKVILSATLTRDLSLLSQLSLRRPQLIVLDRDGESQVAEHSLPALLQEHAIRVHNSNLKPLYLLDLLRNGHMTPGKSVADGDSKPPIEEPLESDSSSSSSSASDTSSESDTSSDATSDSGSDTTSDSDSDATSDSGSDSDSESDSDSQSTSSAISKSNGANIPISLIFTKSNEAALRLSRLLVLLDKSLEAHITTLTSTTPTHLRRKTLRAFTTTSSPIRLIVASDLVARGIDLPNLENVINYDLPPSVAGYVHRVGRTARAGKAGSAWTLVGDDESGWFWGKIAKGSGVRRAQKVDRVRIEEMDEARVEQYEAALEKLGEEAVEMRKK